MSPGFTPRPSLSGLSSYAGRTGHPCVAGVHAPAFVERAPPFLTLNRPPRVSPGFTPRPSLSARRLLGDRRQISARVSPGFTPRPSLSGRRRRPLVGPGRRVSPGFTPRPSLSVQRRLQLRSDRPVSPGFTPRPSLSAGELLPPDALRAPGVAGVHAPAFVERPIWWARGMAPGGSVAGVHAPAFVERGTAALIVSPWLEVSPGFTPRPSLSDRRGAGGGLRVPGVAGVHAPAFVERCTRARAAGPRRACRRGSRPGLR